MMEIPKLTKKEFEKVIEVCTSQDVCEDCPMCDSSYVCGAVLAHYIKENEPAPAGTDTSSEKENILHLDDSTLLGICQEGMLKISNSIIESADGNDYILGYIHALINVVKLRGGDGNAN